MLSLRRLLRSFRHALQGVDYSVRHERNFQFELFASVIVMAVAWWVGIHRAEWIIVFFLIFWVLSAELMNTAVERIINVLKPTLHPYARVIKDVMAAAVLMSALAAAVIGLTIFLPYLLQAWAR